MKKSGEIFIRKSEGMRLHGDLGFTERLMYLTETVY
jgi:hypothetical protein